MMQRNRNKHTKKNEERTDQTRAAAECSSSVQLSNARTHKKTSEASRRSSNQELNNQLDRSCPICLETFDKNRCQQVFTICGHSFCKNCLERTLKIRPFCPLCREYQPKNNSNDQHTEPIVLDQNIPWNPQVVRAFYGEETIDENGRRMRTVCLSDGEVTNIHVDPNAKIKITGNNFFINGKRVQNPSDCNQQ